LDALQYWVQGFSVALQPMNLLYAFIGCVLGTLIGVLPGLGPAAGTAILIPVTFSLDPIGAIIMLAAIYYGAMYGGTITSVLVNVPGEAASVVTCLDGYQMARQGRAGPALGIAAFGSFIAGTLSVIGLMVLAPPLAGRRRSIRPSGVFQFDDPGLDHPHLCGSKIAAESDDHGRIRPDSEFCGPGSCEWPGSLYVWTR
jgi:putative tricarboxylic transport membrane protein